MPALSDRPYLRPCDADGDEDAILGMLVLLASTREDAPRPGWWEPLAEWAYDSSAAFLRHSTQPHATLTAANGRPLRIVKLGSCWGGWAADCVNPSYLSPAHYRAFRDFMVARHGAEGKALAPEWDALIDGCYLVLEAARCPASGLVPNWFVPSRSAAVEAPPTALPSCAFSGTPPDEFGSEASRAVWRVALDALWHGEPRAVAFTRSVAAHAATRLLQAYGHGHPRGSNGGSDGSSDGGSGGGGGGGGSGSGSRGGDAGDGGSETMGPCVASTDASCPQLRLDGPDDGCDGRIGSVHKDWASRGFMLAPVASALLVPLEPTHAMAPKQQRALDIATTLLRGMEVDGYYDGAWVVLGTLTLTGHLPALAPLLASFTTARGAPATPATVGDAQADGTAAAAGLAWTGESPTWHVGLGGLAGCLSLLLLLPASLRLLRRWRSRDGASHRPGKSEIACSPGALSRRLRARGEPLESEERQSLTAASPSMGGEDTWTLFYEKRTGRPYAPAPRPPPRAADESRPLLWRYLLTLLPGPCAWPLMLAAPPPPRLCCYHAQVLVQRARAKHLEPACADGRVVVVPSWNVK